MDEVSKKNLDRLKELTLVKKPGPPGPEQGFIIEYEGVEGTCVAYALFASRQYAACQIYLSRGSTFPQHSHPEWEHVIVVAGELILHFDNEEIQLPERTPHSIVPGRVHGMTAVSDCWSVWISLPPSWDYPGVNVGPCKIWFPQVSAAKE